MNEQARAIAETMPAPKPGVEGTASLEALMAYIHLHGLEIWYFNGTTVTLKRKESAMVKAARELAWKEPTA